MRVSETVPETVSESLPETVSVRRPGRLRRSVTVVATAVGALALATLLPASSAGAATGPFSYVYDDGTGAPRLGLLADPPSRECLTLPEVADPAVAPAHTPRNYTASTATVFAGADCTGDYFNLRPNGGHASERLKVRSVVFS
ncbi:hypothetical protein [Streptomyces endophytica]|uniref:Uncharacterized protein n=1 Tax=Streptomyces endophytica TaxID=2991496 RepID=A0ABY6P938_9ACTN|nr:hypothetical protein [Streptomyces endophytica]UZJ30321.1 hypothetical protein OJ254_07940 [Streptomyces endophytica]